MRTLRFLLAAFLCASSVNAVTIDTVPIGNPGNAADTTGVGAVPYAFNIGKYEVTNAQYTEFLNSVDPSGANARFLHSDQMFMFAQGGINRNVGAPSGSRYSVIPGRGDLPVVYVGAISAFRFANWMHNGQGPGDTETGAYTIANSISVERNPGAKWWVPSDNEWYKAAYHKNGGTTGNYWDYPTSTDAIPFSDQPPGSGAPVQSNVANYFRNDGIANNYNDGFAVTGSPADMEETVTYLTNVGAYTLAIGPYGTFDQGGNAYEWVDTRIPLDNLSRWLRGGGWRDSSPTALSSSTKLQAPAPITISGFGFRLATVPEPSTIFMLGVAISVVAGGRHQRRVEKSLPA